MLAGLIGLMVGSLRVLWPWPNGTGQRGEHRRRPCWPSLGRRAAGPSPWPSSPAVAIIVLARVAGVRATRTRTRSLRRPDTAGSSARRARSTRPTPTRLGRRRRSHAAQRARRPGHPPARHRRARAASVRPDRYPISSPPPGPATANPTGCRRQPVVADGLAHLAHVGGGTGDRCRPLGQVAVDDRTPRTSCHRPGVRGPGTSASPSASARPSAATAARSRRSRSPPRRRAPRRVTRHGCSIASGPVATGMGGRRSPPTPGRIPAAPDPRTGGRRARSGSSTPSPNASSPIVQWSSGVSQMWVAHRPVGADLQARSGERHLVVDHRHQLPVGAGEEGVVPDHAPCSAAR